MAWIIEEKNENLIGLLSFELGISKILAHILIARGYLNKEDAKKFLEPKLKNLSDPFEIINLEDGVTCLSEAINSNDEILIFGDYDVDGITSVVQILSILSLYGINSNYFVPNRLNEGYGLTQKAIDSFLLRTKPSLVIVVDCGTNAYDEIEYLYKLGIKVIVIDHHKKISNISKNCILINPHVNSKNLEIDPSMGMSAAGLVFKFLHGFIKYRRQQGDPIAEDARLGNLLDLAGFGTLADLVPLTGENRIISWYGLQHIKSNKRLGLLALIKESKLSTGYALTGEDISYKLAPRVNACGRLGDASLPVDLLLTKDKNFSVEASKKLTKVNKERQKIEKKISLEVADIIQKEHREKMALVLSSQKWHPGVLGIVASRISRNYNKPCILLSEEGGIAKGSGRSISGVDLVKLLKKLEVYLDAWGGHPMAVGISIKSQKLLSFSREFDLVVKELHPKGFPEVDLKINSWLERSQLNEDFMKELELLQPYGQENKEPIFGLKNINFDEPYNNFGDNHCKFSITLDKNSKIEGVAWNAKSLPKSGDLIDIAFRLGWNSWNNHRSLQLTLVDWRKSLD